MKNTFRAFHYDIARGSYLTNETFCTALRVAARSGFTHFIPYLENMIRLPSMEKACPACAYTPDDWQKDETTVAAHADSVFWIPARGALTVRGPRWTLQVDAPSDQTAGYLVDWGAGFVTPDLHGVYRKLDLGEETVTRWSFTVQGPTDRV